MINAIEIAKASTNKGQYALGAIIVSANGEIIATGETTTEATNDATAHAEINAIRASCTKLKSRYLEGAWLYTTLEPCPMCTGAAIWAKMKGIVFGATQKDAKDFAKNQKDKKFSWRQIDINCKKVVAKGNPKLKLVEGFMKDECKSLFNYEK